MTGTVGGTGSSRRVAIVAAALSLLSAVSAAAAVDPWPTRPVTLIVPFPPSGGTDTGARLLAPQLAERWKQPVTVENRPGAAGAVGADAIARARPDGYTLLVGNVGTQSINPVLYRSLPYDAETAFVPVTLIAELPLVLLVHPSVPAHTPHELIDWLKSRSGQGSYSSSGSGGAPHLAAVMFEARSGTRLVHMPFKGGAPALAELAAGHVSLSFGTVLESIGFVKEGRLRAVAVAGQRRSPALPGVPTLAESALPGFDAASWIGLVAPAGTPPTVVERIAAGVRDALAEPKLRDAFVRHGAIPVASTPQQFRARIASDRARYERVIREHRISVE